MAKKYRRFIKINGSTVGSPEFDTKKAANDWYADQLEAKRKLSSGRRAGKIPTFLEFSAIWVRKLIKDYEKPTWGAYEANLRLHLLPQLKDYRMNEISRAKAREVLMDVVRRGYSVNHRKHVQTTLSKIFVAAMNNEPPLIDHNPVYKLTFEGKRQGKFKPALLETDKDVADFLRAAQGISASHFVFACLGLMSALRRGEMIALRWSSINWAANELVISETYRDAIRKVTKSTKSGENTVRLVSVSKTLIDVLEQFRKVTRFSADSDFVLANTVGNNRDAHAVQDLFVAIREAAGRPDLTIHSMRHTYGRLFVQKTGNPRVLQAILGHSSPAMTAKYSELTAAQVKPFADTMTYEPSESDDVNDTKSTQRREES